jgi:hypothetical protein
MEAVDFLDFSAVRAIWTIRPPDRLKVLAGFVFVSENWISEIDAHRISLSNWLILAVVGTYVKYIVSEILTLRTAKMFRTKQTDAERREKNRLRSERWRRAHGIGPRRPAKQPWLAEGVSRSTWYRRRKRARGAATACATLERAEAFATALTRDLARCAALSAKQWRSLRN